MDRRKELVNEYKQRKPTGGIYKLTNSLNGRYLLGHTHDLKAMENRFNFSVANDSCVHPRMKDDWAEYGCRAFAFEVIESIDIKEGQSRDEFMDDLKTLEEMWRKKLDASMVY
ncbi:GIY-YIG nuclease family protein [Chloroflexota bacterium]